MFIAGGRGWNTSHALSLMMQCLYSSTRIPCPWLFRPLYYWVTGLHKKSLCFLQLHNHWSRKLNFYIVQRIFVILVILIGYSAIPQCVIWTQTFVLKLCNFYWWKFPISCCISLKYFGHNESTLFGEKKYLKIPFCDFEVWFIMLKCMELAVRNL